MAGKICGEGWEEAGQAGVDEGGSCKDENREKLVCDKKIKAAVGGFNWCESWTCLFFKFIENEKL
jgi:hypothetical protein